jgi:hypothetical protein
MPNMKFSSAQDITGMAERSNRWDSGSHPYLAGLEALIRQGQEQFKQILPGASLCPGQASGARR